MGGRGVGEKMEMAPLSMRNWFSPKPLDHRAMWPKAAARPPHRALAVVEPSCLPRSCGGLGNAPLPPHVTVPGSAYPMPGPGCSPILPSPGPGAACSPGCSFICWIGCLDFVICYAEVFFLTNLFTRFNSSIMFSF